MSNAAVCVYENGAVLDSDAAGQCAEYVYTEGGGTSPLVDVIRPDTVVNVTAINPNLILAGLALVALFVVSSGRR